MTPQDLKQAKHKAILPNGRDRKSPTKFEDWWAKVHIATVKHPAWRSLTASAKDVMIVCTAKAGNSASKGIKDDTGCPIFQFTYAEAKTLLNMPSPTFDRSMTELKEKGFLGVIDPGGIRNGKGSPAKYHLTDRWKTWEPPMKDTTNMDKARAARKISKSRNGV